VGVRFNLGLEFRDERKRKEEDLRERIEGE